MESVSKVQNSPSCLEFVPSREFPLMPEGTLAAIDSAQRASAHADPEAAATKA